MQLASDSIELGDDILKLVLDGTKLIGEFAQFSQRSSAEDQRAAKQSRDALCELLQLRIVTLYSDLIKASELWIKIFDDERGKTSGDIGQKLLEAYEEIQKQRTILEAKLKNLTGSVPKDGFEFLLHSKDTVYEVASAFEVMQEILEDAYAASEATERLDGDSYWEIIILTTLLVAAIQFILFGQVLYKFDNSLIAAVVPQGGP